MRPIIECSPVREIMASVISILAMPPTASTLPRSPACLSPLASVGAPWLHPSGLKCGPALVQPLVLSPNLKERRLVSYISQI